MKNRTTAALALVGVLSGLPMTVMADSGFFVGGSVGSSTLDDDIDGFGIETDTTAWRVNAGWQFSEFFSLEGGFQSFGDFDDVLDAGDMLGNVSLSADGYTLGISGGIPVGQSLSLFARGGAFFWEAEARIDNISAEFADDTDFYYGGGAAVKISERLSLTGDWARYELDETESDVISIGFKYRF